MGALTQVLDDIYDTKLAVAEKRRLAGRALALALHGAPAESGEAPCAILEDVLEQAGMALGLPAKADISHTKAKLRATGAQHLAAKVGRLSKARNAVVHDTTLPGQVGRHLANVEKAETGYIYAQPHEVLPTKTDQKSTGMTRQDERTATVARQVNQQPKPEKQGGLTIKIDQMLASQAKIMDEVATLKGEVASLTSAQANIHVEQKAYEKKGGLNTKVDQMLTSQAMFDMKLVGSAQLKGEVAAVCADPAKQEVQANEHKSGKEKTKKGPNSHDEYTAAGEEMAKGKAENKEETEVKAKANAKTNVDAKNSDATMQVGDNVKMLSKDDDDDEVGTILAISSSYIPGSPYKVKGEDGNALYYAADELRAVDD